MNKILFLDVALTIILLSLSKTLEI